MWLFAVTFYAIKNGAVNANRNEFIPTSSNRAQVRLQMFLEIEFYIFNFAVPWYVEKNENY